MRLYLVIAFTLVINSIVSGQKITNTKKQLTHNEIDLIFTNNLKHKLDINNPIHNVYEYTDEQGNYLIVLTQNEYECKKKEKCYDSITAYCFLYENEHYTLEWKLDDFIRVKSNDVSKENSISFWTNYFAIDDFDADGQIDPILVYGTLGLNGRSDGRIKIVTYYKGKKKTITQQNSTLDFERNTQVEKGFYQLPTRIQARVIKIIEQLENNDHAIFPYAWRKAMVMKKLKFDEN